MTRLRVSAAQSHDFLADGGRSGEGYLVDAVVRDNGFSDLRAACHDIQDSCWETGFDHARPVAGGERSLLGGL